MRPIRAERATRETVRLSLPTVGVLVALVGAGAFAAGQSISPDSSSSQSTIRGLPAATAPEMNESADKDLGELTEPLPPGHPPIDSTNPTGPEMVGTGTPAAGERPVDWQAPRRWQPVANASTMRIATYRVPRAPGDPDDAELSITQAGGSVDANAERWIGQFDASGQKAAKRSQRKVGLLEVTKVEVEGTYSGGMGKDSSPRSGWALLGAIVLLPGMPVFFKLTGPARTVREARAEFDSTIGSLAAR
jgi:hypothetical protein